jgi:hypothetical protein
MVLAGDYNVIPTELDFYKPERWVDDALFRPESREAYRRIVAQGWTDALRAIHPGERIYTFWDYFRNAYARNAGLRFDHLLLSPAFANRMVAAGVDRHAGRRPAIMRQPGSSLAIKPAPRAGGGDRANDGKRLRSGMLRNGASGSIR